MSIEVNNTDGWVLVSLSGRVDAFNFEHVVDQLRDLVAKGHNQIALNLTDTKFLSLQSIKFFSSIADEVRAKDGRFALLGSSEKLKRQIHTFASLEAMQIYRSCDEWQKKSSPASLSGPEVTA